MSTNHTPGPWEIGQTKNGSLFVTNATGKLSVCNSVNGASSAKETANARLIAAAPDLLAALQQSRKQRERSRAMDYEKQSCAEELKKNPRSEQELRARLAELIAKRDCTEHKEEWRNARSTYGDTLVHCKCGRYCWASEAHRPCQEVYWTIDREREDWRDGEIAALEEYLAELSGTYAI